MKRNQKSLVEHCRDAAKIVSRWPRWKRTIKMTAQSLSEIGGNGQAVSASLLSNGMVQISIETDDGEYMMTAQITKHQAMAFAGQIAEQLKALL